MITSETATVYRTSKGHRYFTKRTAVRRDVIDRLRDKEDRDGVNVFDEEEVPFFTDEQMNRFHDVADRYWRRFFGKRRKA